MNMGGDANLALIAKGLFQVRVDWVDVPEDRLRTLKKDQARAIGEAIKADRQYDAIAVTQLPGKERFLLVDGLHRLEGCRMAGIAMIEARLVSANRESRRRQEVLSAWARAGDDAFDTAAQVAEIAALAKSAALPEGEEDASAIVALALNWDQKACADLNIGRRNLFRYLKLHRSYTAEQKELLRKKGVADELMPLMRLADLPPEELAVAWAYIEQTEEPTIAAALALVTPAALEPAWEKQKAKVLTKAKAWQPHQLTELINELRDLRRAIIGDDSE